MFVIKILLYQLYVSHIPSLWNVQQHDKSTFSMRSRTSNPWITLPNTVYNPLRCGCFAYIMKNWLPLVLGPLLAIASTPLALCCKKSQRKEDRFTVRSNINQQTLCPPSSNLSHCNIQDKQEFMALTRAHFSEQIQVNAHQLGYFQCVLLNFEAISMLKVNSRKLQLITVGYVPKADA